MVSILPRCLHFGYVIGEPIPFVLPFGGAQRTSGGSALGCPAGTMDAIRDRLTKPGEDGREDKQISGSNKYFYL